MLSKLIVLAIFAGIVASLGSALLYLVRDEGRSSRVVRALTVRIGLSVALFILLLVLWGLGVIQPHGVIPA